jgi:hypothetical protein
MEEKLLWVIDILMGIVLALMGYNWKKLDDRIATVESRPDCKYLDSEKRMDKIELRQGKMEDIVIGIRIDIGRIAEAQESIKEHIQNYANKK